MAAKPKASYAETCARRTTPANERLATMSIHEQREIVRNVVNVVERFGENNQWQRISRWLTVSDLRILVELAERQLANAEKNS